MKKNILVIKHGALGDIIQATEAFRCIRQRHETDNITIMTRKTFVNFCNAIPLFNDVVVDSCPKINIFSYIALLYKFSKFDIIYDFQHSNRTKRYKFLSKIFCKKIHWSSIPSDINQKDTSAFEIFKKQLLLENINNYNNYPYLDFMSSDINSKFDLPDKFAIVVAGCSQRGIKKQWDAESFANVCNFLSSKNMVPVFIGSKHDKDVINQIIAKLSCNFINLCCQTTLFDIAELGRKAALCIAIDTGPAHVIAGVNCKTFVIFNNNITKPQKSLPAGKDVTALDMTNFSISNLQI